MRASGWALVGVALAGNACSHDRFSAASYNGYALSPPIAKPAVVWQRADGTPFDFRRETAGRVTLLFFGYTHCPDICPVQLTNIATALRRLGADTAAMIRVLFVTVDPARDTGSVLSSWLKAIDPQFIAVRGPLPAVTEEQKRLGLAPPPASDTTSPDPPHSSAALAFAADDSAHFMYPPNISPDAWAHDLRNLLRAGPR